MSESSQSKRTSRKIIQQLVSRLKPVKQVKQAETMISEENSMTSLETIDLRGTKSTEEISKESLSDKFKAFCLEVERFASYLINNDQLILYVQKYPQIMQDRINVDVEELQSLLGEIKETITNIKKLKTQQKLVKKEIVTNKKIIRRIKDKETKELESIVSRYDKEMFARWSKAKWKYEELDDLFNEVQEKQMVMESLNKLINRHLEVSRRSPESKHPIIPIASSTTISIPSPVPRPIPLTANVLNRNNRLSWVQRRFRAERRGNFASVRPILENRENEPFVFSFNMNNNYSEFNNNQVDIDSSRFSCESSGTISSQLESVASSVRRPDDDFELRTEIQSVLQTLFGQDTSNSILMITESNDSCQSQPTGDENANENR